MTHASAADSSGIWLNSSKILSIDVFDSNAPPSTSYPSRPIWFARRFNTFSVVFLVSIFAIATAPASRITFWDNSIFSKAVFFAARKKREKGNGKDEEQCVRSKQNRGSAVRFQWTGDCILNFYKKGKAMSLFPSSKVYLKLLPKIDSHRCQSYFQINLESLASCSQPETAPALVHLHLPANTSWCCLQYVCDECG